MSQMPPPVAPPQPGYSAYPAPGPQKSNGVAIGSLICGILGCVPFITSIAAVILGVVGIKKTKDPQVGGKGLAIAGLVLGIVGLAGWGLFGGFLYVAYAKSVPARAIATQFATDLAAGNTNAAVAATGGMTAQQLDAVSQQMKPWGGLTGTAFPGFNTRVNVDGTTTCELTGTATFATAGQKTYTVTLVKNNGVFKINKFNFQ